MKRLCLGVFAFCALIGATRGTQDAVANGDTRTIEVMQMHTKERISVTFRRNGRYDQNGLQQLNWIMRDWRRDEATKMNPRLYDLLWEVHRSTGSRQPVRVVSAYRSPQTNAALRRRSSAVAETSQHMSGNAVDFYLSDVPADRIRAIGMRMQRGGVGYYPRANTPFIHLDVASVRHWPRMSRQQLVNMFPDQRTAHIPTDGKPLARFEEARREILAAGGMVMGEAGTAVAQEGTGRRSLWAALFGGGGEESNEDIADANSLDSNGWVSPGSMPRSAPAPTAVASAPPPEPVLPRVAPVTAPPPPAQLAQSAPEPRNVAAIAPLELATPRSLARVTDGPVPIPMARPRQLGTQVATATPIEVSAEAPPENPAEPQLVWREGPAGQPLDADAESVAPQMLAELPLPPRRPAARDSIGTLVTAFASTSGGGSSDALTQLGIGPQANLRGGVAPGGQNGAVVEGSLVPAMLPPRREVAALTPPSQPVASEAQKPAPTEAVALDTPQPPRMTASIAPRPAARNVISIARDEGAALRSLFAANSHAAPTTANPARIAVARVRRDQPAPTGFVSVGGSGLSSGILAQGFSKSSAAAIPTGTFAGPAVAPLRLRP
ncbi:MAG TPA: DUF882 domain-containing protein [Saliniramus sp.]|nr:DUF882 domain-containing protein [Saliniramus sp.]